MRTLQRWLQKNEDGRKNAVRPAPSNKLTEQEKADILKICNSDENSNLPPSQIVPKLADNGEYLASESSFYRVLHENNQQHHRGRAKSPQKRTEPTTHIATAPNQVWSWDITYCPTFTRGKYYYLYMFEDIFSRKIVGWEVHENECGGLASEQIEKAVLSERCLLSPLILHSDNGSPMKSSTLIAKLDELGVTPSRGRPRVSNDNPYSEALFKTLKYRPDWPADGFEDLNAARKWVEEFVNWYNNHHLHSEIRFVSPAQRHANQDASILAKRHEVYEAAKKRNPNRWSGKTRNWSRVEIVTLNPSSSKTKKEAA